jgi:hypothetical protein
VRGISAIVAVAVLLVAFAAAGSIVTAVTKTSAKPPCPAAASCLSPGAARGPSHTATYRDTALGFSFQYPDTFDSVEAKNGVVVVDAAGVDDYMSIKVVLASSTNAATAFENLHSADQTAYNLGDADTTSINRIVSPQIGFVPGVGATYEGVIYATNGGKDTPVNDAIIAASDGRLTVAIDVAIGSTNDFTVNGVRSNEADLILDSFTWHS